MSSARRIQGATAFEGRAHRNIGVRHDLAALPVTAQQNGLVGPPPSYIAGAETVGTAATPFNATMPTNQNGDLITAQIGTDQAATSVTPPAGWTLVPNCTLVTDATALRGQAIYYKFAASEPANYSWTVNGGTGGVRITKLTWRDCGGIDASSQVVDTTTDLNVGPATNIWMNVPGCRLVFFARIGTNAVSFTPPAGYTTRWSTAIAQDTCDAPALAKGNSGAPLATYTTNASHTIVALLALKPGRGQQT